MGFMLVSCLIPARNERFLKQTIQDLLHTAQGAVEIIAILEGYWPNIDDFVYDPRVSYIHYSQPRGMRNAINSAVRVAKGEYILKTDAHCLFAQGWDRVLKEDYQPNWIIVPRRYRLDPNKWEVIKDSRIPVDYEYLDLEDLHGIRWDEKAEERKDIMIDPIISAQGSCWFTRKDFYEKLRGLDDENYGTFYLEFQELAFKAWTHGGQVMVDKNTYYAHYHKPKTEGRGYSLSVGEREKAVKFIQGWRKNPKWREIINKFLPMPTW